MGVIAFLLTIFFENLGRYISILQIETEKEKKIPTGRHKLQEKDFERNRERQKVRETER